MPRPKTEGQVRTFKTLLGSRHLLAASLGAFAGALIATFEPSHWSNLAFMPWYVEWFSLPAFVVMVSIAVVARIDIISDLADPVVVARFWTGSMALSLALWCLAASFGIQQLHRLMRSR